MDSIDVIDLRSNVIATSTPHNINGISRSVLSNNGIVTVAGLNTICEAALGASELSVVHTFDDDCELHAAAVADSRMFCAVQKSRHTYLHILQAEDP